MGARFIEYRGDFLKSHLEKAEVSERLGRCMDVNLDAIPPTWPLVTQMYLIVNLFDDLYKLAASSVSAFDLYSLCVEILAGVSRWIAASRSLSLQISGLLQDPGQKCRRVGCRLVPTGILFHRLWVRFQQLPQCPMLAHFPFSQVHVYRSMYAQHRA